MLTTIQTRFNAGELSPDLFSMIDLKKWHEGASTMRNFFANYRGGANSRAGTAFVGRCKQVPPTPPRDIPFQFNINQGYTLEFGDQYMRIKSAGAYVTQTAEAITGISNANPGVLSYTNSSYTLANNDWVFITGVTGMTDFNGMTWIVKNATANSFTLEDLFGNAIDTRTFAAYISGGTLARIYTVVAPYAAIDLPYLKYTQSANTMTLCCVNQDTGTEYPSQELQRLGATNWTFTPDSFGAQISAPANPVATAQSSTTIDTWYSYVVTAVNADGEESIASVAVNVENNNIAINAGSNTVTTDAVTGATSYNFYKATPSYGAVVPVGVNYGFAGSSLGPQFVDNNITADFTQVPPQHRDPFARGAITSVTVTAPGTGFTQAGIGYTVTTATGTGFVGIPVVISGQFVSFIVQNPGHGYLPGDTIAITGGNAGGFAAGSYTFNNGNPTNTQTIVLNGVTWTFTTGAPGATSTKIGTTLAKTLAALAGDLGVSTNVALNVASYSVTGGTALQITYGTAGVGGNAYTLAAGTYAGTISGATLTGGGATPAAATLVIGAQTGTYPSVPAYFQQRRFYADTTNQPDTYFGSQPGRFLNMDYSVPSTASDAIVGTPWAQQINGIQFMVPMNPGMIILTGNGAWLLTGSGAGTAVAITPADQNAQAQSYNGCSNKIQPIIANLDIIYVQSKGSIVRDLSFNFFTNIFTGTDQTVLASHLFNNHQIVQWAYAEEPSRLIWTVRDDGIMLSFTYLKEQQVAAWARHDTNGFFIGVCTVTEPPVDTQRSFVDAVYLITERYVRGAWWYYAERMNDRNWQNVEDCWCVDAGLAYPQTFPNATLTPAAADGTSNISSVLIVIGGSGYTAPTAEAIDEDGVGTGATFTVTVSGGVITGITPITEGVDYTPGKTHIAITDTTGSGAIVQPVITNKVNFTASTGVFSAANVGDVIRAGGGIATVTDYISATRLTANITQAITATIPNDPDDMPAPVKSGNWSITTPTSTVTNLNHLEGLEVAILADGSVVENQTVTNGQITLPSPASSIVVGLPFTAQLQTMYLDPSGVSPDTTQGKRKDIFGVTVRMESSRGMSVGINQPDASVQPNGAMVPWTKMRPFKERTAAMGAGNAIPLFTGDEYIIPDGTWDTKAQIAIQQTFPLPANCLGVIGWYQVGDQSG